MPQSPGLAMSESSTFEARLTQQLAAPPSTCRSSARQRQLHCSQCNQSFLFEVHFRAHIRQHGSGSRAAASPFQRLHRNGRYVARNTSSPPGANKTAFPVQTSLADQISFKSARPDDAGVDLPTNAPSTVHLNSAFGTVFPTGIASSSPPDRQSQAYTDSEASIPGTSEDEGSPRSRPNSLHLLLLGRSSPTQRPPHCADSTSSCSGSGQDSPIMRAPTLQRLLELGHPSGVVSNAEYRYHHQYQYGRQCFPRAPSYPSNSPMSELKCNHCNKTFLYKCHLARHLSAIHSEQTVSISGALTGRSPRCPSKMPLSSEHIVTEKMDQPVLKCQYCPRTFTQRSSLSLHYLAHQNTSADSPHSQFKPLEWDGDRHRQQQTNTSWQHSHRPTHPVYTVTNAAKLA